MGWHSGRVLHQTHWESTNILQCSYLISLVGEFSIILYNVRIRLSKLTKCLQSPLLNKWQAFKLRFPIVVEPVDVRQWLSSGREVWCWGTHHGRTRTTGTTPATPALQWTRYTIFLVSSRTDLIWGPLEFRDWQVCSESADTAPLTNRFIIIYFINIL